MALGFGGDVCVFGAGTAVCGFDWGRRGVAGFSGDVAGVLVTAGLDDFVAAVLDDGLLDASAGLSCPYV